jgi:hypothetical protein
VLWTDLDPQRLRPLADPGYGTELTDRGTMVMPRLGFVRADDRDSEWRKGPGASDKPSDNGARLRRTQRDVARYGHSPWPAVIRLDATLSDEYGMHGKEKVYGSIP